MTAVMLRKMNMKLLTSGRGTYNTNSTCMRSVFVFLFTSVVNSVSGQMIDNTAIYRNLSSEKSLRLHYENDYFSKSDIYYTQGINLEFVHPVFQKFPGSRLLAGRTSQQRKYGIAAEHLGFTPTSISFREILAEDRPFAASLFLKLFSASSDSLRKYRITSSISAGVIGPLAGAKEFQSAIHRWINDTKPLGWNNQIKNDVVLNYQVDFAKQVFNYKDVLTLAGKLGGRAGTYNTKLNAGVIMMTGLFDDPWKFFSRANRNFQIYVYEEPLISLVGHDATLQGGIFNKNSPYTISASNLERVVFQNNAGLVIQFKKINVEYFQSYLTKEFRTGRPHHWGGVRIGLRF